MKNNRKKVRMNIVEDNYFALHEPELSGFPASDREKELAAKYTRLRRVALEGTPEARTVWIVVGNQQFEQSGSVDDADEGSWVCWMIAKALNRIVEKEINAFFKPAYDNYAARGWTECEE